LAFVRCEVTPGKKDAKGSQFKGKKISLEKRKIGEAKYHEVQG